MHADDLIAFFGPFNLRRINGLVPHTFNNCVAPKFCSVRLFK